MDHKATDFSSYILEDFIDHPEFLLWVTAPDDRLDAFWQKVQIDYPATVPIINDARDIILSLRFQTEQMGYSEQQVLWQAIKTNMASPQKPQKRISFWMKSAAAVLLVGMLAGLSVFYYTKQQHLELNTTFGQVKSLTLPDGTLVTVNANSKLRYPENWDEGSIREVWIEGEAFFNVAHLHKSGSVKASERFIVHAEKLNVEVLGTSFNVNNRRGLIKVALVTGKVSIDVKGLENSDLNLEPGELAEYREKNKLLTKARVHTGDYVSWKNGVLHFNNTPLSKVLLLIEDNYGYKAVMKDTAIGDKKLSGTFSFSSADALFKAISTSLGISIEKNQTTRELIIK